MKKKELKKQIKQLEEKLISKERQKIKNWIYEEKTRDLVHELTHQNKELEYMVNIINNRLAQNSKIVNDIISLMPKHITAIETALDDNRVVKL